MGYIEINLIFQGDVYLVEVDGSATPSDLCEIAKQNLGLDGDYRLVAFDNFGLVKDSRWELVPVSANQKVRKFEKQ